MKEEIKAYNDKLTSDDKDLCDRLATLIDIALSEAECKIWHSHPVWFLDKNPILGYSKQKAGIRLMFWSGADFDESALSVRGGKFKDASILYNNVAEIDAIDLNRWIEKSKRIQWDYKNIVQRKGKLEKINLL